jgi:hypothetical protein
MAQSLELVTVEKQDYWIVEDGSVSYSKYAGGGAYSCAANYVLDCDELVFQLTPLIYGSPFGWKYDEKQSFDLRDPESFARIGATMRKIADGMHTDRRPW